MNTAVFICTHGRPDKQYTYHALREAGYTGNIIFIVDNEDFTADGLCSRYVNKDNMCDIHVFDKQYFFEHSDRGTNENQRKCILYAKCCCEDRAKYLGLDAFIIADDDITGFRYRYDDEGKLKSKVINKDMDIIIQSYYELMLESGISMSSFGDVRAYIGGTVKIGRIPYNFVFRNTYYAVEWKASMYEDTVTPLGVKSFTLQLPFIQLIMKEVDAQEAGGMSDTYKNMPVYKRAFAAKIFYPTCISIANNKVGFKLIKDNAFAKLVSSSCKKV